jgi:hypothetical protein
MKNREKRRWLTARHAQRTSIEYRRVMNDDDIDYERVESRSKKRNAFACACSKKSKNNPKYGNGICYACKIRPTVRDRIYGKLLCMEWMEELAGGIDPLDIDPIINIRD